MIIPILVLLEGRKVGVIILITVTDFSRIPASTRFFLEDAQKVLDFRKIGIDLRETTRAELKNVQELKLGEYFSGRELSSGEVGCLLSHQAAYKLIIDSKYDWALIIEDDAELAETGPYLLNSMRDWSMKGFEFVHLSASKGGVVLQRVGETTGRALVPPLLANAYWISSKGAQKLQTNGNIIGGLADWPVQIAKVKMRATTSKYFLNSGKSNSVINPTRKITDSSRIEVSFRKVRHILFDRKSKYLLFSAQNYGIYCTIKYVFLYRFYRRFARAVLKKEKGFSETLFLRY